MKMKKPNKILYWSLIGTFIALYLAIAFVSTLHAITFFQLANSLGLAILLGAAYEIGQASVLFSILMTENRNKALAWGMMFLLTALQVTANVYASFKFMDISGTNNWTYWQRAILFGVQAESPEMYKIIISWISGALLPLVALGMTALVAENIRLSRGEELGEVDKEEEEIEEIKKEGVDELNQLLDLQDTSVKQPPEPAKATVEPEIKVEPEVEPLDLQDTSVKQPPEPAKATVEPEIKVKPEVEPEVEPPVETDIESITNEIDKELSERIEDPETIKKA